MIAANRRLELDAGIVHVDVEEPGGPGVDVELDAVTRRPVAVRARSGGLWLGVDRGALVDSDDGSGRSLAVLVAVPVSTFAGCRIRARLVGAFEGPAAAVLVACLDGVPVPAEASLRAAGGIADRSSFVGPDRAVSIARAGRHEFRRRQSHARVTAGRAWSAGWALPPELARSSTPHSAAEYSLRRLPPRFIRGLDGVLDREERILYWVERPPRDASGVLDRLRPTERRSALLLLTDRQLIWMIDHADPGRFLVDWGVDIGLIPVESVAGVAVNELPGRAVELRAATTGGGLAASLPTELTPEVRVMSRLVARFVRQGEGRLPVRRYSVEAVAFDPELPRRFGATAEVEALQLLRSIEAVHGPVDAAISSPRRPGRRRAAVLAVTGEGLVRAGAGSIDRLEFAGLGRLELTLSELIGRVGAVAGNRRLTFDYPAPFSAVGTAALRAARRRWANAS